MRRNQHGTAGGAVAEGHRAVGFDGIAQQLVEGHLDGRPIEAAELEAQGGVAVAVCAAGVFDSRAQEVVGDVDRSYTFPDGVGEDVVYQKSRVTGVQRVPSSHVCRSEDHGSIISVEGNYCQVNCISIVGTCGVRAHGNTDKFSGIY